MEVRVKVTGIEKLVKKLDDLTARPLKNALTRAGLTVEREAKLQVPVDTGRLRNSITYIVDPSPVPTWVQVGTNVKYARFVELGTKRHFPPPGALGRWAKKHGMNAYALARAISRRGTKAHPYLRPAFEASRDAIQATLQHAAEEIKARWQA